MDWGIGSYEHQAPHLLPAVRQAVAEVAAQPGEFVVDVGCGAGSAALLIAAGGASVVGVDPAPRLLEVARSEAARRAVSAKFLVGDAANLPMADGTVDAVVSTFALIFVPDPATAVQEIVRVLKLDGRLVFSAWIRSGGMARQADLARQLLASSAKDPAAPVADAATPAAFAWSDPDAVAGLLSPLGFSLSSQFGKLAFTGESPRAAAEAEIANHPRWANVRQALEPTGRWEAAQAEIVRVFTEVNEDPAAFRVTSEYVIHAAVRTGQAGPVAK